MRKFLVLFLGVLVLGLTANGADAITNKSQGYISVKTSATKEFEPTIALITFTVETTDKTLEKASELNKKASENVYMALKGIIDVENGDWVKTANFTVTPVYSYENGRQVFNNKYTVTNSVLVKTDNVNLISKLIDTSLAKGANRINNLEFLLDSYDSECAKMLAEATVTAKNQAQIIAKSVGKKVSSVKAIDTNCSFNSRSNILYRAKGMEFTTNSDGGRHIEAGKVKVEATVNAEFYVK